MRRRKGIILEKFSDGMPIKIYGKEAKEFQKSHKSAVKKIETARTENTGVEWTWDESAAFFGVVFD